MKIMKICGLILLVLADFSSAAPVPPQRIFNKIDEQYKKDASSVIATVEEELGNFFEGDMVLTSTQQQAIEYANSERNGLRDGTSRWPNRTVVYHIVKTDFDVNEINMIENAMKDITNKSCIQFRQRRQNERAVTIQGSGNGCFSSVGYIAPSGDDSEEDEPQVLNLSKGCLRHGTIVHEMLHTLGFYHMQSTYDRDDFVKIVWENIQSGTENNFAKYRVDTITDFGVRYDYGSVMHYSDKAFSKNGNRTIIPLQKDVKIGQRNGLSESDILKLNRMYCKGSEETGTISYMKS